MRFSKIIGVFASAVLAALLTVSASATEYLFKLREDAALLADDDAFLMTEECFDDDSALARTLGVYTTDDISIIEKYRSLGMLEYYEENAPAYLLEMPGTNEYMTSLVYGYVPIGESYAQLNVDSFWKLGLSGKGIVVGVIDSGANEHSALEGKLLPGYNTYDKNYNTADGVYHGTMVSGLIAGNGTSYMGTAYNAKIVPIKAFNDKGSGNTGTMANGILEAVKLGCDVINMSCGSLVGSLDRNTEDTLRDATEYALKKGVIIVAAAGNVNGEKYGTATVGTKDSIMYPAAYDGVISVGNIDRYGNLSSSSIENDYVDVVAPGKYITGLLNTNPSGYKGASGTSFASPIVAGVVACMLEAKPDLTPAQIETMLQETATDLGNAGKDFSYGYGKVNCTAIASRLLDGKIYRSNVVTYKNTHNIAIRNGLDVNYNSKYFFATYNKNKMIGIKSGVITLGKGDRTVISTGVNGTHQKFFEVYGNGLTSLHYAAKYN